MEDISTLLTEAIALLNVARDNLSPATFKTVAPRIDDYLERLERKRAARARLMEVAPELLERLINLVNIVTHPKATRDSIRMIAEEAMPVIRKARLAD